MNIIHSVEIQLKESLKERESLRIPLSAPGRSSFRKQLVITAASVCRLFGSRFQVGHNERNNVAHRIRANKITEFVFKAGMLNKRNLCK